MAEDGVLAQPELYRAVAGAAPGADACLLAVRCADCGHLALPRQRYGCEACGSLRSEDVEVDARGTLGSFATVHLHPSKSITAPFVIGEIQLDAGPSLRTTLVEPDDRGLRIGARMRGVLHPAPGSESALELRFTRESTR